jgi:hypothetical protein
MIQKWRISQEKNMKKKRKMMEEKGHNNFLTQ